MSRRIDIELTNARPDGTWTWRAAGAQQPKGVLDGSLVPAGSAVGTVFRADAEHDLDGITILSLTPVKGKSDKGNLIALLPSDKPFEAVTQQLARKERGDRGDRRDRGPRTDRGPRQDRGDRGPRGERSGNERGGNERSGDRRGARRPDGEQRGPRPERRPRFEAPPELPQRPKAKRLRPGRTHRTAALTGLSDAERTIAERILQGGIPAVRQALNEQNQRLRAEGQAPIDDKGILKMAEDLQPTLRVAEWRDRADAAMADLDDLDLRDLRSVVVAADDPMVARDESTRELASTLKAALTTKQEQELTLWLADIDAAIGVGRVVRALKLSSQPPKAGVRFPAELATRLVAAAIDNLTADALPDRWAAVLEAAAFSPVRQQIVPTTKPAQVNDELLATVRRLAPALPAVAALFDISVDAKAAQPKPLRPTRPGKPAPKTGDKPAGARRPAPPAPPVAVAPAAGEMPSEVATAAESPVAEAPVAESAAVESPVAESPAVESNVVEPAAEVAAVDEAGSSAD